MTREQFGHRGARETFADSPNKCVLHLVKYCCGKALLMGLLRCQNCVLSLDWGIEMEIETIAFRLFDANKGTDKEYLIPDTIDNQEMVFQNKHTHDIQFGKMFDFQFAHEEFAPKFIEFGEVYLNAWDKSDNHLDISDVDEMVGCDY